MFSGSRFMWNYTGAGSAIIDRFYSVQRQFTESLWHDTASDIAVKLQGSEEMQEWLTFRKCGPFASLKSSICTLRHPDPDHFNFIQRFNFCPTGIFPQSGKFHFFSSIDLSLKLRTGLTCNININM